MFMCTCQIQVLMLAACVQKKPPSSDMRKESEESSRPVLRIIIKFYV